MHTVPHRNRKRSFIQQGLENLLMQALYWTSEINCTYDLVPAPGGLGCQVGVQEAGAALQGLGGLPDHMASLGEAESWEATGSVG